MSKIISIAVLAFSFLLLNCKKEEVHLGEKFKNFTSEENSYYPMHLGNLWKIDDLNQTEIVDTIIINRQLFFKFNSIIGGDAISVRYLRIDENENLIEAFHESDNTATIAKFSADLNEEFYTLEDESINDLKVKVVEKTENSMTFEYQMVYHPNLDEQKFTVTYIKGLGPHDVWKDVTINGKMYNF